MHVCWLMCICLPMWWLKVDVRDSLHHSSTLLTEAGTQSNSKLTNMLSVAIQLALGIHLLSLELQVGCRTHLAFMCVSGDPNFGVVNHVTNLFWVSHAPPPVYLIVFADVLFPFFKSAAYVSIRVTPHSPFIVSRLTKWGACSISGHQERGQTVLTEKKRDQKRNQGAFSNCKCMNYIFILFCFTPYEEVSRVF